MIHTEVWYREAQGSDISRLLHRWDRGEDIIEELAPLILRLNFPAEIPEEVYKDIYQKVPWEGSNPQVQRVLSGIFTRLDPDFVKRTWGDVNNWDPRQLKEFFEGDQELQDLKYQEEDPMMEEYHGYRAGFLDATDFVEKELAPAFEEIWESYQRDHYVSPEALDKWEKVVEAYNEEGKNPVDDGGYPDTHRDIFEYQMQSAQLRSEFLGYFLMAGKLSEQYGPTLFLSDEVESFPQRDELRSWLNEMWALTDRVLRNRNATAYQIRKLKEMTQEWQDRWLPLVEDVDDTHDVNRYEQYWMLQ